MVSGQARPMWAKRFQPGTTSGIQVWQRRHLALQGRVSCRDPAVPVTGSDAAVATVWRFHPMTQAHGCKKQRSGVTTQDREGHPARATNPRTGGHRPKNTVPYDIYPRWLFFKHGWWSSLSTMSRCSSSCYTYDGLRGIIFFLRLGIGLRRLGVPPGLSRLGPGFSRPARANWLSGHMQSVRLSLRARRFLPLSWLRFCLRLLPYCSMFC